MRLLKQFAVVVAAGLPVVAAAISYGEDEAQLAKVRPLLPFFQIRGPLPLYADGQAGQTAEEAQPKKRRPLVAPFVRPKININTATLAELQSLPGVDPAMAAHILAGRPYRDFGDLERNGVPLNVVSRLRGTVTVGR
jgi:hypothetical protein